MVRTNSYRRYDRWCFRYGPDIYFRNTDESYQYEPDRYLYSHPNIRKLHR